MRFCTGCKEEKPTDSFPKQRRVCKKCVSARNSKRLRERYQNDPVYRENIKSRNKAYRENNPAVREREYLKHREAYANRAKKWRQNNPVLRKQIARRYKSKRATWELKGKFTQREWDTLLAVTGYKCLSCLREDVPLTADHIVPLSKGGTNFIDNIQPLCGPCNSSKHTKTINYKE